MSTIEREGAREGGAGSPGDAGVPAIEGEHSGRWGGRGGIVTITTVIVLLLATALTLLGVGAADNAVANFDASSWMWSSTRGEVDRVNGVTARVDTRTKVKDAQNHDVQISQTDRFLILRDLNTGQVSTLDLTSLQISAVMATAPGLGVSVALHGDWAFVIDSVQGQVRQLDPKSLAPTGESLVFPPGISAGAFDGQGTLWLAVPSEGTVVAIAPGLGGASPKVLRTVTVAPPDHDLAIAVLDRGVAVLDNTQATVVKVKDDKVDTVPVPLDKPAAVPARTSGDPFPVTISDDRHVFVVAGGKVSDFVVPGSGPLDPAVAFAGHFYAADPTVGIVYDLDGTGHVTNQIKISSSGGGLELDVREGRLFINAPDGSTARVVDENHKVSEVNKYDAGVLGADPPPPAKTNPPPKPLVTKPGKPAGVTASAGDATARVSWRKARDNGSAITKYVIEGGPKPITVGANVRSVTLTGLTNGQQYRFSVHAVNAKGAGPKAFSNTVMPSSDVPEAPKSVTAKENPDGSVQVTWPAANGLGRKIIRYTVTAITGGNQTQTFDVKETKLVIPDGSLTYGTQYAFNVIAINDKNNSSEPSPLSNTVVPFSKPGKPRNLTASTASSQKGAIQVAWQAANDNGREITKYVVEAGGKTQDVTDTSVTLSGFGDDQAVTVTVKAVNAAGEGPTSSATARTIGVPSLTFTSDSAGYNSVTVTFTPNNKNGAATCRLAVSGAGSASTNCTTSPVTLTVNGLWPNNTYSYTISITNAAGNASANRSRPTTSLRATVLCGDTSYCGTGIWIYSTPSQQNPNNAVGRYFKGNQFTPQCHIGGDSVNAKPWGGKDSTQWLRLSYQGKNAYFPWAWATLDGGDNINTIPAC